MSHPSVAVIIPALNEELSIGKVVLAIPKDVVDLIIVVDNGSSDDTASIAKDAGATVLQEKRKGYGWACLKGIDFAKTCNSEILVFMDGDYSDYPEEIPLLLDPIVNGGMDLVIGSRILGKREKGSLTPQQRFGNWLATRLMKLFYRVTYTDLGPFRSIKIAALDQLHMSDKTYGWTIEMQIKAAKHRLKACEVPVNYKKRIGKSKVSGTIKGTVLAGIKIIFAIFKYRF